MSLTIGIVGLPNVGKSTLFNALAKTTVLAENYPFATIEPNVGTVPLIDERLDELAKLYQSERIVQASVSFVDIAGIVKGASKGEGLGNKFLANIREANAICQVVRVFDNSDIVHVEGRIDPLEDIETITTELILADLESIEKQIERLTKQVRNAKEDPKLLDLAKRIEQLLEESKPIYLHIGQLEPELREHVAYFQLLTSKPVIYCFNIDYTSPVSEELKQKLTDSVYPAKSIFLDAKFESELIDFSEEEAKLLLSEVGQQQPGLERLAKVGFDTLGLQTFLTAGPKEARAWTINQGDTAPVAAGAIHTDFEKGFIKAEVISYQDLMEAGSVAKARTLGKVRLEGKDYVMQDGDVVEFKFNV